VTGPRQTPEEAAALRQAMLSVYYRSLGRQWEFRGAPAVLLPPEIEPLDLREALERLSASPSRLRHALWRLVRSVPVYRMPDHRPVARNYPGELLEFVGRDTIVALDERRRAYRDGATLFSATLESAAGERWDQARELAGLLAKHAAGGSSAHDFSEAAYGPLGTSAVGFVSGMLDGDSALIGRRLSRLEDEIGIDTHEFVSDFADAVAFLEVLPPTAKEQAGSPLSVYPVSSSIRQDTFTLVTVATVTTIVQGSFTALRQAVDPRSWPVWSDVVRSTAYVDDAFALNLLDPQPEVGADDGTWRLLTEQAVVSWGVDPDQQGSFDNVLNSRYTAQDSPEAVDLEFRLARSIRSRLLWDRRRGGILVDQGYIKVRRLTPDRWRVTSRKVLQFSDRTPDAPGGSYDLGQTVNYLTPAALSWWVESETYSLEPTAAQLDGTAAQTATEAIA
jgi:hypothetical protein